MSDLFTPATRDWVNNAIQRHSTGIFGKLVPRVIWADARDGNDEPLVPVDPIKLVAAINRNPYILLHNHDPGRPIGQVLESANFESDDGVIFVVAILGYYAGGEVLNFQELNLDKEATPMPEKLPALSNDCWIEVAIDPKEVDVTWLDLVTKNAPLRVERTELSHNAANSAHELISVSLFYLSVVWNPFIKTIASEAGKDTYAAIHKWVRNLLTRLARLKKPILDIQTHLDGCQVSFLFRDKNVSQHYAAHDALSIAAVQAARLIEKLKARGMVGRQLVYEFDKETLKWFPSYAILNDARIILHSYELIAIDKLPAGLSLGLNRKSYD